MNIYEKLAAIQQELVSPKNHYSDFGKYNYRSCEDILESLKPLLKKVNAVVKFTDEVLMIGNRYYIKTTATLYDCETEASISNTAYARETDEKPKMDASQITGSASSYARKYALNGLFCIDDAKDADSMDNEQQEVQDEKKAEEQQAELEKAKIPEVKQKALSERCTKENVDPQKIMKLYKVNSFVDLSEKQFRNINDHWEDIKKVC